MRTYLVLLVAVMFQLATLKQNKKDHIDKDFMGNSDVNDRYMLSYKLLEFCAIRDKDSPGYISALI